MKSTQEATREWVKKQSWHKRQPPVLPTKEKKEVEQKPKTRTTTQNAALHVLFGLMADTLNGAGYTVQKTLSHNKVELDWSANLIKDLLWRPVQKALTGKKSTTELAKHEEIDLVYEHLVRFFGEKLELEMPEFPHTPEGKDGKIGNYATYTPLDETV